MLTAGHKLAPVFELLSFMMTLKGSLEQSHCDRFPSFTPSACMMVRKYIVQELNNLPQQPKPAFSVGLDTGCQLLTVGAMDIKCNHHSSDIEVRRRVDTGAMICGLILPEVLLFYFFFLR